MSEDIKEVIADEAKRIVCGARREAYGTPEQNFDRIAVLWNTYIYLRAQRRLAKGELDMKLDGPDVAAMMRLMKEARLIETPDHRDSYVDLVGYALCGAEIALSKDDVT